MPELRGNPVSGADPLVRAGPPGLASRLETISARTREAGQGAGRGPGGPPHFGFAAESPAFLKRIAGPLFLLLAVRSTVLTPRDCDIHAVGTARPRTPVRVPHRAGRDGFASGAATVNTN